MAPVPLRPYEVILYIGVLHGLSLSAEHLCIQLANVTKSILSEKKLHVKLDNTSSALAYYLC